MIPCPKWIDVESTDGGGCMDRQEFVAWEACRGCPLNPDPAHFPPTLLQRVRLGDKVEAAAKALGIPPCKGCKRRKDLLNGESAVGPLA
jgi:hypothetical protein